jgi:hypothetical protein
MVLCLSPVSTMTLSTRYLVRQLAASAALLVAAAAVADAQATTDKKPQQAPAHAHGTPAAHTASGWSQMDAFHEVLQKTWHPAARSNDLRPIRTTADTLAQRAEAWAQSTPPAGCDSPKVKESVQRIQSDTRLLVMAIRRNAPDGEVKAALKGVHDVFGVAERGCTAAGQH